MASQTRPTRAALIEQLLREGEQFGFFQAVRLLQLDARAHGNSAHKLKFRPRLSLAFPESDIHEIQRLLPSIQGEHEDTEQVEQFQITANFGGLYGVDSPLPTFYTEELIAERREDRHAIRDFLDVLHSVLYPLLYQSWHKPRLQLRINEEQDLRALQYLHAFIGVHHQRQHSTRRQADMLRYAGLLAQRPKSALGLQCLLNDALAPASVEIRPCEPGHSAIPIDQRCQLGVQANLLGEDTVLGELIPERMSSVSIHVHELEASQFETLMPGQEEHARLCTLIQLYLDTPLNIAVALHPKRKEIQPAQLGLGIWSSLGLGTWLSPESASSVAPARFVVSTNWLSTTTSTH